MVLIKLLSVLEIVYWILPEQFHDAHSYYYENQEQIDMHIREQQDRHGKIKTASETLLNLIASLGLGRHAYAENRQ